ncbi:MAG TPA: prepilin-type N-terminal cleavage/methylation domain-containing protein [Candidatus Paceibacterota bacterium]|nr:prepilin-type N-terminal cleavage/methylation domain-containing protein [Candidatus Paceibacterota bacterium]
MIKRRDELRRTLSTARGFTLVEILVVIAIIGILAAIILVSLSAARAQARDTQRISDIKQIQLALSLYYDACGEFPTDIYVSSNSCPGNASITGIAPSFISVVPLDPSTGSKYKYTPIGVVGAVCNSSNLVASYHLGATLETTDSALANDADAAKSNSVCTNFSDFSGLAYGANCSGPAGAQYPQTPNTETCYDVTP